MLVRLACGVALAGLVLMPNGARAQNCADEISKLMSKDTEKLTTRYQRVTKQIQDKGSSPKLVQEECRIARELSPRLEDQPIDGVFVIVLEFRRGQLRFKPHTFLANHLE